MTFCPLKAYNPNMDDRKIEISRADERDIPRIGALLMQVNNVHAAIRPDLFFRGGRKYTDEALSQLLNDETRPVFAARRNGILIGYAFCKHETHDGTNEPRHTTLYIDDLCVEESERGTGVGRALYEHVLAYARMNGFYNVTLNVWEGNGSALKFYQSLGLKVQKYGMEIIL